ncbi:apolipoprotein A1/A4/E family protein [Massilia sp. BJB1822]|uniref:apolipoprotein A1/A4/E family protein n=1 Tax=Massilia sp. BJB1822 TaxID=2744470 RepID=UPI0015941738|nr:apolipoprotein A1/A4/E family protein [Massilia sp. BJB1822]NVD98582.1 apolipoprotein A1/A4/E family protein [Massilia sp. BJB1822]
MNSNTPIPQLDKPHPATEAEKTEARLTRLETTMEQLVKVIDQMQLDMREGFRSVNARVDNAVTELRVELHSSIDGLRTELHGSIDGLRTELHSSIDSLRAELHSSIDSLRTELHSAIAEMRAEHRSEMQEMRREMATYMRWLLGIIFTSFMSLLAMVARINNLL